MNQSIVIGPLALQAGVLVALAAITLGWFAAGRSARARAVEVEWPLYAVLGAGLLGARAAYVLQNGGGYFASPLSILDLRDGGWSATAGFLAAAAAALLLGLRRTALRKPLALGLATSGAVWGVALAFATLLATAHPGLPTPTVRTLDGRPVSLASFKGRPVVVNLWATWCPPCIREMPVLQQAQRERREIQFVFLNQGEDAARVQGFLAGRGLALENVLLDGAGDVARQMGQRALPTTFFFDAQGRLVDTRIGGLTHGALEARLSALAPAR